MAARVGAQVCAVTRYLGVLHARTNYAQQRRTHASSSAVWSTHRAHRCAMRHFHPSTDAHDGGVGDGHLGEDSRAPPSCGAPPCAGTRPLRAGARGQLCTTTSGSNKNDSDNDDWHMDACQSHVGHRDLFLHAANVQAVVRDELHAEVARDSSDGFAAVPPLAPHGWSVQHTPGTAFFCMTRTVLTSSSSSPRARANEDDDDEDSEPRYKSIHEEHTQRARQPGHGLATTSTMTTTRSQARAAPAVQAPPRRGAAMATTPTATSGSSRDDDDNDDVNRHRTARCSDMDARVSGEHAVNTPMRQGSVHTAPRSETHVTVFAPFRVCDASLYEPSMSVCEWAAFDVLVRKTSARTAPAATTTTATTMLSSTARGLAARAQGQAQQRGVCDESCALFLRLACVNGALRMRRVQLLTRHATRALAQQVAFGKGDPVFHAVLHRRRRQASAAAAAAAKASSHGSYNSACSQAVHWHGDEAHNWCYRQDDKTTSGKDDYTVDAPQPGAARRRGVVTRSTGTRATSTPATSATRTPSSRRCAPVSAPFTDVAPSSTCDPLALTSCLDAAGDVARAMLYAGPYLTELSKELHEELLRYVVLHLGVDAEVTEYICQMQYYLEQDEYMRWLARCGDLADTVLRPPSPTS